MAFRDPRFDELLTAIDVVRCPRDSRILHQVNRQRGDIGRPDAPPDRHSSAALVKCAAKIIAENGVSTKPAAITALPKYCQYHRLIVSSLRLWLNSNDGSQSVE